MIDDSNILSELSTGDGLPPALCTCLADGTPLGPHCVHAREWPFRGDDLINGQFVGVQRARKHGGASTCPRACVECADGAHHFCEIDVQPEFALNMSDEEFGALDEEEREEVETLRNHPAHLAGCESWYECRHCDAWIEASDDDGMSDDEDDVDCCDDCGETLAFCDCDEYDDDDDDSDPDSMDLDEDPERADDDFCDGCDELTQDCTCEDEDDNGSR